MATYQIFNSVTGELVRTEMMDDDKLRPMVPEGCALRPVPVPLAEPPAPVEPVTPAAEAANISAPDEGATTTHEGT